MSIEGVARTTVSILLFLSSTPQLVDTNVPNIPVVERTSAVLPERLKIPGSRMVEDKRPTLSRIPELAPGGVLPKERHTKVRFS